MTAESLLERLEPLTHHERVRRMVALGQAAAKGDADARAVIAALRASPDAFSRVLAMESVYGSRDGAAVIAGLADASRTVRARAATLLPIACDDAQVRAGFALIRPKRRTRLLVTLRRRGRGALVDAIVRDALRKQSPRAIDLAAYGSDALVAEILPRLDAEGGLVTWSRLANWHGARVADFVAGQVTVGPHAMDVRLRLRLFGALEGMADKAPDATLRLVGEMLSRDTPHLLGAFRVLLRRRPRETFDLLRARHVSGRPAPPPGLFSGLVFDAVAPRLGAERLGWLVENAWSVLSDGDRARRWWLKLSSGDRDAVVQTWLDRGRGAWGAFLLRFAAPGERRQRAAARWSDAARDRDGVIATDRLAPLPRDLRIAEARRHLSQVAVLSTRPRERAAYARLLPYDEARAELAPFLGHPEGEERAAALTSLVASIRFEPARMGDLLDLLHGRRFEQDPVRMAMMQSLGTLPVVCFRPEVLPKVGQLVRDALDAADLSWGTAAHVQTLVARLFRVDAAWGAQWLTTLLEARGSISGGGLGRLTAREVRVMSPVFAEVAGTWATRERAGALLWLAAALGKRLRVAEPLCAALERLASALPFVGVAGAALGLLRRHDAPRFRALVPALLAADPSYIILPDVARYVSMHRQDLLTQFLGDAPMTGRFASGRTGWLIEFHAGWRRWTPDQHRRLSAGLSRVANEADRDLPSVLSVVRTLPRLIFGPAEPLLTLAGDTRPAVREAALRAIPWLDAGEGVPLLIDALGDDRARIAIYALRKAFSEMERARVLQVLQSVPMRKVTVAKEVVRLLGELGGEDAWRALMALEGQGTHRDVRIALMRGLWDHLHRDETWAVFERAAQDRDWVVASRLADLPLDRLSVSQEERILGLLVQVLGRAEPEARLALLERAAALPVRDTSRRLFGRLLEHVGAPTVAEGAVALQAVLARMRPDEAEAVAERFRTLMPRRQNLLGLVTVLAGRLGPYAPAHVVRVAERVCATLEAAPLFVLPSLQLATHLYGWRPLAARFVALATAGLLHADAMAAALGAVRDCLHPELLEAELAKRPEADLRRLALEALRSAAGPQDGWTPARRARLATYRKDASPLVAEAALSTFPPDEAALPGA
jgi:hypothetical protein